jgi:pimeloyl-ACP methyl ester carboxylesterase
VSDEPSPQAQTTTETVDGVKVDVVRAGAGKTLLYLHSVDGVNSEASWFRSLAERYRIVAPWHPGFGHSERPAAFRSVGDLAFFYLEFLREHKIENAVLMGSSFGGWLATEIAIRSHEAFSHLVLIDPLGIKVGGREDRDITDVFAISQDELTRRAYHSVERRTRDYSAMTDAERLAVARSREAYTYYGWRPFMHNPSLRRWLRRIRIPTLVVWGESDGIVTPDYGLAFASEIPDARFARIAEAGHYPHVEQPEEFVEVVCEFLGGNRHYGHVAAMSRQDA